MDLNVFIHTYMHTYIIAALPSRMDRIAPYINIALYSDPIIPREIEIEVYFFRAFSPFTLLSS